MFKYYASTLFLLSLASMSWCGSFYEFAEFTIISGTHHFEEPDWLKVSSEGEAIKVFTSDGNIFKYTEKAGKPVNSNIRGQVYPSRLASQRIISLPFSPLTSPHEVFLYLQATPDEISIWNNIHYYIIRQLEEKGYIR